MTEKTDPYDALLATIGVLRGGARYYEVLKVGDRLLLGDEERELNGPWYPVLLKNPGEVVKVADTSRFSFRRPIPRPTERILEAMREGYLYWHPEKAKKTVNHYEATGWIDALEAGEVCKVPPSGWSCTRPAGHDGPCAAIPCEPSTAVCSSAIWLRELCHRIPCNIPSVGDASVAERIDWRLNRIAGLLDRLHSIIDPDSEMTLAEMVDVIDKIVRQKGESERQLADIIKLRDENKPSCYLTEEDDPSEHDLRKYSAVCGQCYSALAEQDRWKSGEIDKLTARLQQNFRSGSGGTDCEPPTLPAAPGEGEVERLTGCLQEALCEILSLQKQLCDARGVDQSASIVAMMIEEVLAGTWIYPGHTEQMAELTQQIAALTAERDGLQRKEFILEGAVSRHGDQLKQLVEILRGSEISNPNLEMKDFWCELKWGIEKLTTGRRLGEDEVFAEVADVLHEQQEVQRQLRDTQENAERFRQSMYALENRVDQLRSERDALTARATAAEAERDRLRDDLRELRIKASNWDVHEAECRKVGLTIEDAARILYGEAHP